MDSDANLAAHDRWDSGAAYEAYVGRWSRMVAREFIRWLGVPPRRRWLDVGSGTGALSTTILEHGDPVQVTGVDRSEAFVSHTRQRITDRRAEFRVGDAQALPIKDGQYDAVVSGLVLNFVPDQARMASEMLRAARPGGVVGVYVWDYADGMQMMRVFWEAAASLTEAAGELDEGRRFPICQPEPLKALFENADGEDAEARAIEIPTRFRDFDDYWTPFLGGTGAAPGYLTSLREADRVRLREAVRSRLPFEEDGSIEMTARAWGVRVRRSLDGAA